MQYVLGRPYFVAKNEKIKSYPYLGRDISCDILIIGGGIDGSVANYFLSPNYDVALVDKSRLGHGATSCATSLLEYQLDEFASDLKKYLTKTQVLEIYRAGIYGICKLEKLVKELQEDCYFKKRPSLIYSNCILHRHALKKEFEFRQSNGLKSRFLKNSNLFGFHIDRGIFCENGGGEVDPYLLEKALIHGSRNQDKIFENTEVREIQKVEGGYLCVTAFHQRIFAREVVLATGFNFQLAKDGERLCKKYVSYTIVTPPIKALAWSENTLIQDCKSPYHYLRKLPDGRIIFGGEDSVLKKEINAKQSERAYQKLLKELKKLFPSFAQYIKIDYSFAGVFCTTKNNLGIIGRNKNGIINFYSCGANGIVNSMFGIEIVEGILQGREDKFLKIFSPLRKY